MFVEGGDGLTARKVGRIGTLTEALHKSNGTLPDIDGPYAIAKLGRRVLTSL